MKPPTSLTLAHGGTVRTLRVVGRGAVAVVLRGELDGRAVGVKIDVDEAATSEVAGERLAQEAFARAIAAAGAPIDGGRTDAGRPYLAFEWVEGEPPRGAEHAEVVQRDVAAALARLHLLGFRHGDVKRENIVVSADGARASLIDFGLAAPMASPLTGATPENLPPEVLAAADGVLRVGAEADVFALGRTLVALGGDAVTAAARLAVAESPGDRPSAAVLAGWQPSAVPLSAAYLVERREELARAARAGQSPPEGPAGPWVSGLMRALAGLSGARATGPALAPLDGDGRRRLLVRLVGAIARDWRVLRDEPALLEALGTMPDRALSPADLSTFAAPGLSADQAVARLAISPGDDEALAALESAVVPDALAPVAIALLRRSGRIAAARRLPAPAVLAAELSRLGGDAARAGALLDEVAELDERAGADPHVRALRARLALDRGAVEEAERWADGATGEARALVAHARGRFDEGLGACDAALADEAEPERRARLLHVRGMLLHGRGDASSAARAFARAADLAAAIGATPLEASARASAAAAAHDAGRLGEALEAAERAIAALERVGRFGEAARARLTRAACLVGLGALTDALVEAERAELGASGRNDARGAAYALFTQIEALSLRSRPVTPDVRPDGGTDGGTDGGPVARADGRALARRARALLEGCADAGERVLLSAYASLAGEAVPAHELAAARAELSTVEPASVRWTFYRAHPGPEVVDFALRAPADEAPPSVVGPVLALTIEQARASGRGDAARALADRLARLVARLEEDLPLAHRASFAALAWVEAARANGGRGEQLGLGEGQIDLLAAIARGMRDRTTLGDLLRQVLDGLVLWVGVERGLLLLRASDPDAPGGIRLVPRVARGLSRDDLRGEQLALSTSLARRALETMEPVVAVDASGASGADVMSASIHALRLRSVLAVPLVARGEALGVVYLDDRIRRGAFGPREVAWVRLLATQAAAAIADARDALRLRRLARRAERAQARLEETLAHTEGALEVARAELAGAKGRRATRHPYAAIVGDGAAIRRTLALVDRVTDASDSRIPVLVLGESGTGKELVARAIHDNGPRARGAFVAENCGAIPEPLLESTLFGHVRGAFTGADRSRVGLFEVASGGTLMLDEIGEMPLSMQAKLLRVLQEGEVRPVGSERSLRVDVRVIGATHRDLGAMVREGRFREDLYYRLAVLVIPVPSLRERSEDVPALVEHFVRRWSGTRKVRVSREALAALAAASWPGNIRQLENELRRALVLCDDLLEVEHLSPELTLPGRKGEASGLTLHDQLDALERRLVVEALRRAGGNQTHAAKALGVSRFGLQKMVKRLGLPVRPSD